MIGDVQGQVIEFISEINDPAASSGVLSGIRPLRIAHHFYAASGGEFNPEKLKFPHRIQIQIFDSKLISKIVMGTHMMRIFILYCNTLKLY